MASIHRKSKNGTYYISYRQQGVLKHRSLGTKKFSEARRLQRELETKLTSNSRIELFVAERQIEEAKNPTVDAFWTDFKRWAHRNRSRHTLEEYENWFKQFVEFSGIEYLGDASVDLAQGFKDKLSNQGKRKPEGIGLDRASVNSALRTLGTIWNHARKLEKYTGANPFKSVERYSIPQKAPRDFLDREQIDVLMQAARDYASKPNVRPLEARNVQVAIALMAWAGLRRREVCYARWEWIKWVNRVLIVSNHEHFTTKNRRSRSVSMNDALIESLSKHRAVRGYVLIETRPSDGRCKYRADFKNAFQRVCDIAGVKATPHDLRHSFASRHAVAGTSLHVIAGWLGHSTTSVTERYAHFQTGYNEAANNI